MVVLQQRRESESQAEGAWLHGWTAWLKGHSLPELHLWHPIISNRWSIAFRRRSGKAVFCLRCNRTVQCHCVRGSPLSLLLSLGFYTIRQMWYPMETWLGLGSTRVGKACAGKEKGGNECSGKEQIPLPVKHRHILPLLEMTRSNIFFSFSKIRDLRSWAEPELPQRISALLMLRKRGWAWESVH